MHTLRLISDLVKKSSSPSILFEPKSVEVLAANQAFADIIQWDIEELNESNLTRLCVERDQEIKGQSHGAAVWICYSARLEIELLTRYRVMKLSVDGAMMDAVLARVQDWVYRDVKIRA